MTIPAIKDFLGALARRATVRPGRPVLCELTEHGWVRMTDAEFLASVDRVARNAARLSGPVIAVLDGSAASVAVLLGLLAGSVDVLAVEHGNSHLNDHGSAIWTAGARALIDADADHGQPARGLPVLTYRQLLSEAGPHAGGDGHAAAPPPAILLLTSGSTGEPRIARQPLDAVLRGGELYQQVYGYHSSDQILLPIPIAHSFGLIGGLLAGLGSGAEVLTMPTFSLSGLLSGLNRGASVLLGSPLLYTMLTRVWGTSVHAPGLRLMLSSGGPLAEEIAAGLRQCAGTPVRQIYGSTETGLIACQDDSGRDWQPGSAGTFAPGVEWELLPLERSLDGPAAAAERGRRLLVRTSTMFTGYTGADPALRPDGYYETGDLAEITGSGEVFIMGRKNTFINVGGKKTNPRRVERTILEHPDVGEVHVFAMAAHHEQAVHAAVVPAPGSDGIEIRELAEFCRSKLAAHEVPHQFHILPQIPRTALGKVDHSDMLAAITENRQPTR